MHPIRHVDGLHVIPSLVYARGRSSTTIHIISQSGCRNRNLSIGAIWLNNIAIYIDWHCTFNDWWRCDFRIATLALYQLLETWKSNVCKRSLSSNIEVRPLCFDVHNRLLRIIPVQTIRVKCCKQVSFCIDPQISCLLAICWQIVHNDVVCGRVKVCICMDITEIVFGAIVLTGNKMEVFSNQIYVKSR